MELKLGRVIISKDVDLDFYFKDKNRSLVHIEHEYTESKLPTLIIGWGKSEELFDDNISILNKKIKPNLYWTFSPSEKMEDFNEDTINFIDKLYGDFIRKYDYCFIDPIIDNITRPKHILRFSTSGTFDCAYVLSDFLYLFSKEDKTIFGIDLKYYKILGFDTELLTNIIVQRTTTSVIEDYTESGVYQVYKDHVQADIDKKYIPALYLLNH